MIDGRKPEFASNRAAWRLAAVAATVSGLFVLIVCISLITNYLTLIATQPLDNPELLRMRDELAAAPDTDEALIEQVRVLDLVSRKAFFTNQEHLRLGGELLLLGTAIFLIAVRLAARWNPKLPAPKETRGQLGYWESIAQARKLITGFAVILVVISLGAAWLTRNELHFPVMPTETSQENLAETVSVPENESFPGWEAMQQQWPSFRGPGGFGVAYHTTAPIQWDGVSGEGIRWKVEAPATGFNSPVVWDKRIFLSGATEDERTVYCYDTESGELLWQSALPAFPGTPEKPPEVTEDTGYAASSMAAHGDRVFAIFANGDLACLSFEGELLWGRNLGVPDNHYGHASSLIAYEDLLFVQLDDKTNPRLLALDIFTGKERWAAQRSKISWASPVCIPAPSGAQLVLASERNADAYDPKTGGLLWTEECLDGEVAPSPAYGGGHVFVANEYAQAAAIRLNGTGAAATPEIVWEWDEALPDIASPVGSEDHFYIATPFGELVCLDISNGENVWTEEFDDGFQSSPVLAGDRIYALDQAGVMRIVRSGAAFELIGSPELGEPAYATPAFLDNRIYVRTERHLFCIEGNNGH